MLTLTATSTNNPPVVDLNGAGAGVDFAADFAANDVATIIVDPGATVGDAEGDDLGSMTVTITNLRDDGGEFLAVDTSGTNITANYAAGTGILELTGSDTAANYQQVLRTLTYDNTKLVPTGGTRTLEVVANDGTADSATATASVTLVDIPDKFWDGGGVNNLWLNRINWDADAIPVTGDNVLIQGAAGGVDYNNNTLLSLDSLVSLAPITMSTNDGLLAVSGVVRLTQADLVSPGTLNLNGNFTGIRLTGSQTFDNASVSFASTGTQFIHALGGTTLTLGPALAISGGTGTIGRSGVGATIVNQGTITANVSGQAITIKPSTFTNDTTGVITATNGGNVTISATTWTNLGTLAVTDSTLTLGGDWDNSAGTIEITGGELKLGGTFTTADMGTIDRPGSAGTVTLTGDLDNSAGPLIFSAATGTWNVFGGTIAGGVIQFGPGGEGLNFLFNSGNTLDGVTLNGPLDLSVSIAWLNVVNGLTLNDLAGTGPGTLTLSGTSSRVRFSGDTLLDNASIVFGPSAPAKFVQAQGGTTLTLGPDLSISGGTGQIGQFSGSATIVNQGTITADVAARTITINPTSFINTGTLEVTGGGALTFSGGSFLNDAGGVLQGSGNVSVASTTFTNAGTISPGAGVGTLNIVGDLTQGATAQIDIEIGGTTSGQFDLLNISGTATLAGTLNVTLINAFTPSQDNSFEVLTAGSIDGTFDNLTGLDLGGGLVLFPDFDADSLVLRALQAVTGDGDANTLTGGPNGDLIDGQGGADSLSGGGGNDVLIGGAGDDTLTGGSGGDTFKYTDAADGLDAITDFTTGEGDVLDLADVLQGPVNASNLAGFVQFADDNTNITVEVDADGGGDNFTALVVLQGVTGVTALDFLNAGNLEV